MCKLKLWLLFMCNIEWWSIQFHCEWIHIPFLISSFKFKSDSGNQCKSMLLSSKPNATSLRLCVRAARWEVAPPHRSTWLIVEKKELCTEIEFSDIQAISALILLG